MADVVLLDLALFVAATFAAALVAGVAGFAFGLVAAAVWLHVLTPLQTTTLIVAFGLIVQGYAVWKLRHALNFKRLLPFVLGGVVGIPVGVELLRWTPAAYLRIAVGILLVLFSLYSLARPQLRRITAGGRVADGGVGFLSGILGGTTGFGGILPTIWSGIRGWPRDEQRAVFQPTGVAIFLGTALLLGGTGTVTPDTIRLFLIGLPALLAGSWVGLRLYGRLDEAGFRKVVLLLLLASGIALIAPILFVT
jgi:uncharacterized membrane protein YfcA